MKTLNNKEKHMYLSELRVNNARKIKNKRKNHCNSKTKFDKNVIFALKVRL